MYHDMNVCGGCIYILCIYVSLQVLGYLGYDGGLFFILMGYFSLQVPLINSTTIFQIILNFIFPLLCGQLVGGMFTTYIQCSIQWTHSHRQSQQEDTIKRIHTNNIDTSEAPRAIQQSQDKHMSEDSGASGSETRLTRSTKTRGNASGTSGSNWSCGSQQSQKSTKKND